MIEGAIGVSYIDRIAAIVAHHAGDDFDAMNRNDQRLYRIYAVLCLSKGTDTTLKDVHDAWSAWRAHTMPEHRSIIPFEELTPETQALDAPYRDAIHQAAQVARV